MKWGKNATIIRHHNGKLAFIHIEKGFTINHIEKKISVNTPEFK